MKNNDSNMKIFKKFQNSKTPLTLIARKRQSETDNMTSHICIY